VQGEGEAALVVVVIARRRRRVSWASWSMVNACRVNGHW
jgi:hypothetical protein